MRVASLLLFFCTAAFAQDPAPHHHESPPPIPLQPLAQQARRIAEALDYMGQPLPASDQQRINDAIANPDGRSAVTQLEDVLDRYTLLTVDINPESRVKVEQGAAKPELVQGGVRLFLVKVVNSGHVTAPLAVESPNSGNVYIRSTSDPAPAIRLTPADARERWANISLYLRPPMTAHLSGLGLEYVILEIYSRDAGQRAAKISFNVGQGTQDIGFRNDANILFTALPAHAIALRVKDGNGAPAMASFLIRDRQNRVYPSQSKRLAPDFFFQPQVYRRDGETLDLPEGVYTVQYGRGPEYLSKIREFTVNAAGPRELTFQLERWIDPSRFGWYSGDHHVHAAGCSHYENPTEGVEPKDMIRQILGEMLNIGSVLTWGPDYYYQKQFFSGKDHALSTAENRMHYDVEVSGFPSSHAGHIVLLNLKDQDYPGAKRIEDWPTWDLPILQWAKKQGAVVGFAHSGFGLEVPGNELPNYNVPAFDSIGANEYIVDVTHPNSVDFISTVDTPHAWELNIWYHTLNVGFRTAIAGETDFPCIHDGRVGVGRTYGRIDGLLTYSTWVEALRSGASYVSDGKAHLMDFQVNGVAPGRNGGEVRLGAPGEVTISLRAAAYLPVMPDEKIRQTPYDQKPYWDVERARIADSRDLPVEIVVNGKAVARQAFPADGAVHELQFHAKVDQSGWIAARILPAAHTNPVFALVAGRPVRASRRSAEWCLNAVNQCWTQKSPRISATELPAAARAYDHARETYRQRIQECERP